MTGVQTCALPILTKEGIVVLEYRFYAFELETEVFDSLISSLFLLQKEIDML